MKIRLIIISFLFTFSLAAIAQPQVRKLANSAFTFGEKITYKAKYSLYVNVPVGEFTVEVQPKPQEMNGNQCYHLVAKAKTYGFYDVFFKIRDNYESFVEETSMMPLYSSRDVNEGKYSFNETVVFNSVSKTAQTKKRTQHIPDTTMDILTTLYYARTIDFTDATPGKQYLFHTFMDDSAYKVGMEYVGKETIKTSAGTFRCIKLKPLLVKDRIFKSQEEMALWITDDDNHIPVKVESGISVGAVKIELAKYEGLKNNLSAKL